MVVALTLSHVNRPLASKLDAGLSASTLHGVRNVLSQALDYGVREGSVGRNVVALTRVPRNPRREGRTLTPEQAKLLTGALEGHPHEALFVLMLHPACGEVRRWGSAGATWTSIVAW